MDLLGMFLRGKTSIDVVNVSVTTESIVHVVLCLCWNELSVCHFTDKFI